MIMQREIGLGEKVDLMRVVRVMQRTERDARIMCKHLWEASRGRAENDESTRWFCLHVEAGREFAVQNVLVEADIETFVATETAFMRAPGRSFMVEQDRAYLPGYVLVRCRPSAEAFDGLIRVKHVLGLVGGALEPHVIHDEEVLLFKRMADGTETPRVATDKSISQGCEADINGGPFGGFRCVVLAVKWCRQARARVQIKVRGNPFEIEMPVAFLKKV